MEDIIAAVVTNGFARLPVSQGLVGRQKKRSLNEFSVSILPNARIHPAYVSSSVPSLPYSEGLKG